MGVIPFSADQLIFVDANVVIYAVEQIEPFATLLAPLWEAVSEGVIELAGSELLWLETMVKPVKENLTEVQETFRAFLTTPDLVLHAITPSVLETAAKVRADFGIKTPDAIHLANAIRANADLFITNDRKLKRVTALNVLVLNDLLETTE